MIGQTLNKDIEDLVTYYPFLVCFIKPLIEYCICIPELVRGTTDQPARIVSTSNKPNYYSRLEGEGGPASVNCQLKHSQYTDYHHMCHNNKKCRIA